MRKNILFIIDRLSYGGAEKSIFELSNVLSEKYDLEVVLLVLHKSKEYYYSNKIKIIFLSKGIDRLYQVWKYGQVFTIIRRIKPDIIHTAMPFADWIIGIYKLFHSKQIIISSIHSYQQERFHEIEFKHKIHFKLQAVFYKKFSKIVCVSRDLMEYMQEKYSVPTAILEVIPNGIKEPMSYTEMESDKEFTGKLLYIGGIRPVKNLKILISVLSILPEHYTLTFIGNGEQKEEIEQFGINMNISHRVSFLGYIQNAHHMVPDYDILIIPSVHETFSLTALEGLITGIPTMVTNRGGIKELFEPELVEMLFDPIDVNDIKMKILKVEQEYSFYMNKIKALRNKFTQYSLANTAEGYNRVYKNLLNT